jgi:hypothetical protein
MIGWQSPAIQAARHDPTAPAWNSDEVFDETVPAITSTFEDEDALEWHKYAGRERDAQCGHDENRLDPSHLFAPMLRAEV